MLSAAASVPLSPILSGLRNCIYRPGESKSHFFHRRRRICSLSPTNLIKWVRRVLPLWWLGRFLHTRLLLMWWSMNVTCKTGEANQTILFLNKNGAGTDRRLLWRDLCQYLWVVSWWVETQLPPISRMMEISAAVIKTMLFPYTFTESLLFCKKYGYFSHLLH